MSKRDGKKQTKCVFETESCVNDHRFIGACIDSFGGALPVGSSCKDRYEGLKKADSFTGDPDFDSILRQCIETMQSKGQDYAAGSSDRLHNFRTVAEATGMTMEQVWSVYFYKHVSAILSYVKGGHESEPIGGRITDAINYLLLFAKIIKEDDLEEQTCRNVDSKLVGAFCLHCGQDFEPFEVHDCLGPK